MLDRQGDHPAAVEALRRAANAGDVEAMTFLASRLALGEGVPQSWTGALRRLRRAAELGSTRARAQLAFLAGDKDDAPAASWAAMARRVDLSSWFEPAPAVRLRQDPELVSATGFLDDRVCRWLMERAAPLRRPATIVDLQTGATRADSRRSNTGASFDLLSIDLIGLLVQAKLTASTGLPPVNFEQSQVLHYAPGQTFALHHDCLADGGAGGQRVLTALIYLNDDYEGGETEFPRLGLRHRGRAGDALWFRNVDATGRPHPALIHAGLPPLSGEKWVFSQWVRDRAPGEARKL